MEERRLTLPDGKKLFYRVWKAEKTKATVHINHGMAEHSLRYDFFATFLNGYGYTVYCQDHRGHGKTKKGDEEKGWFAEEGGWTLICSDSYELDKLIAKEYPDVPHFIFGHSMGSFLTRTNIALHSSDYRAAIIMGTGASKGIVSRFGRMIALRRCKKYGTKHKDEFLNNLAFGSYLRKFDYRNEGIYCWISSDREEVKKYEEDPDCGFICSSRFYADLIEGLETANSKDLIAGIRKDLPIMFLSGEMDPVGNYSKGVVKASSLYKDAGISDVRLKLYRDGRHEILNDSMRDEVMADCLAFYEEFV